jgi:hypothetical protein
MEAFRGQNIPAFFLLPILFLVDRSLKGGN